MLSPVRGSWHFGSGMTQIGFSPHAHFHERFSYDLTQHDATGATFNGPSNDNNSFYCYGEKVHAMADGVVLGCVYTNPENNGKIDANTVLTAAPNEVILGHDGGPGYSRRSRYVHLQQQRPRKRATPALRPLGDRSQRPPTSVADAL